MKFFITGALGHIGSKVIREIPSVFPGSTVIMLDNLSTQRYSSLFNLPAECRYQFIEADVLEVDLENLLHDIDIVIHLAAITNAAGSFAIREEVERINFNATARVADACCRTGTRMIHLSSTSVYGTQKEVVTEDCSPEELKPQSPYAETKLREEEYLTDLGIKKTLPFVVCRFGTICGTSPGMRFHTAVNKFCWQAVLGQPITVWRTALHQKRPYLTLSEGMQAMWHIITNNLFSQKIYNVLTDNLTVHDIIELIKNPIPDLSIEYVDAEIMNQLSYEVLDKKFRDTGFSFHGDIKNSIEEAIQWLIQAKSC